MTQSFASAASPPPRWSIDPALPRIEQVARTPSRSLAASATYCLKIAQRSDYRRIWIRWLLDQVLTNSPGKRDRDRRLRKRIDYRRRRRNRREIGAGARPERTLLCI
jgi:hypothetical protein